MKLSFTKTADRQMQRAVPILRIILQSGSLLSRMEVGLDSLDKIYFNQALAKSGEREPGLISSAPTSNTNTRAFAKIGPRSLAGALGNLACPSSSPNFARQRQPAQLRARRGRQQRPCWNTENHRKQESPNDSG